MKKQWILLALLFSLGISAQTKKNDSITVKEIKSEAITNHQININGNLLKYKAEAGYLKILN